MSSSLVRKSLALVDTEVKGKVPPKGEKIKKKRKNGQTCKKKLTIDDAKYLLQKQKLDKEENVQNYKALKELTKVELEENIEKKLIEQVTGLKQKYKPKKRRKKQGTAFTEEHFREFEKEIDKFL